MTTPRKFLLAMRDKDEVTFLLMLIALYLTGFLSTRGRVMECSEWPQVIAFLGTVCFLAFFAWMVFR